MSHRSHKETNEFPEKMCHPGKTGFGAGPWTEPERIEIGARAPAATATAERVRPAGAAPTRAVAHSPCRLGDRILTGLAILSLGMLIVGALGAYLSNHSPRGETTTRSDDAAFPAFAAASDARYQELETRLTQLNERYGQRLHTLETKVEQTVDPYEARLAKLENRLESVGDPEGGGSRSSGGAAVQFDAGSYEARLSAVERRLEETNAPDQAALRDLENRMGKGYASYDARLRDLENRLMQFQIPYEQRLQALEQQLIYASARLDYLSAEMETLGDNNAALVQASATLQNFPPAALPPERATLQRTQTTGNPVAAAPAAMPPDAKPAAPQTESVPAPGDISPAPAMDPAEPPKEATRAAAMPPPATQMPMPAAADPAPETPAEDTVPPPAPETAPEVVVDTAQAGEQATGATANPGTGAAPTTPVPPVVRADAAPTASQPGDAAANKGIGRDNAPAAGGSGDWIINLASYASESIAAHKLADFKRKGVSAEQTVATVNGKTIYRVCVTGFDTRKSAMGQAERIRAQLGLKETWITRR
jgi:hypothetical protein